MFQLTIGTNATRKKVVARLDSTPRAELEANEISYDNGIIYFEGNTLGHGELDKTFEDLGVTTAATLNVVIKVDNA